MKIATFNANSVRVRLPILLDWLATNEPDVLAIQETKCEDHVFPREDFEDLGYHVTCHGQKSYNGVALLSREAPLATRTGFGDPAWPEDCRIIVGQYRDFVLLNTYVPNGTKVGSDKWDYKLRWLERMHEYLQGLIAGPLPVIWLGDINIAPTPDDVYESHRHLGNVGHHPDEFKRLAALVELGLKDVFRKFTEGPGHYTYWDFFLKNALDRKLGWRIDHIYTTQALTDRCVECIIDTEPRRAERPSDHTFVMATFD